MKKNFTISAIFTLISFAGFSQCPTYFTRNNGNGTCGAEAQIKMYFSSCPVAAPSIDSVYINGQKGNIAFFPPDASKCSKQGYVSYCFSGDLPPVSNIKVYFNFGVVDGDTTGCDVPNSPEAGPTPVVLTSFDAERSGSSVTVNWKTEQEFNSKGFEIQRSSDNINFETVGFVSSQNSNSSVAQYYSFTDNSNISGANSYYRIKMIDLDNTFSFTGIKTVKGSGFQAEVKVFPNPAHANSKVTIGNLSEPSAIRVFDNTGRLVQQTTSTGTSVDLTHLQKGNYFIKITGQQTGSSTVKKLTVIN
jgi:hypothetical protein